MRSRLASGCNRDRANRASPYSTLALDTPCLSSFSPTRWTHLRRVSNPRKANARVLLGSADEKVTLPKANLHLVRRVGGAKELSHGQDSAARHGRHVVVKAPGARALRWKGERLLVAGQVPILMPRASRSRKYSSDTLNRTSSLIFSLGGISSTPRGLGLNHPRRDLKVVAQQEAGAAAGDLHAVDPLLDVMALASLDEAASPPCARASMSIRPSLLENCRDVLGEHADLSRGSWKSGAPILMRREQQHLELAVGGQHPSDVVLGPVVGEVLGHDEQQILRASSRTAGSRRTRWPSGSVMAKLSPPACPPERRARARRAGSALGRRRRTSWRMSWCRSPDASASSSGRSSWAAAP